ncbi:MAG: type II secretion system F family protein [Clostridia bacterium]|nr:type II secretion system F family protein [Clostridia bacterium]
MQIILICVAVAILAVVILIIMEKSKVKKEKTPPAAQQVSGPRSDGVRHNTAGLTYYNEYKMTVLERTKYILIAGIGLFAVGYIFFNNLFISIVLCGFSLLYPRVKRKDIIQKRKHELNLQFKDALASISSSLSVGRSVEGSFKAAVADLNILYPEGDAFMIRELEQINRRVDMNETVESALADFAARADIDDITNFVDVFTICKSTGGNLIEVIRNTSNVIHQKIEIKNEIEVLIAEQKFSQKILNVMPFGLIIMISTSSPEFIKPLYSPKGYVVMSIVLVLLVISYFISKKIVDIKV